MSKFEWQWPGTGPTPVSYGMDTEIFDTEKFPHLQTFVREAVQNSLDARCDKSKPVQVSFSFHEAALGSRRNYLSDLQRKKVECGLEWPAPWSDGRISWLVVEDSNSTGLRGSLDKRTSDFWNYWMNFGISNKNGSGRGGRGIGRVTFLIASGISTVIGITRREEDGRVAACGMSVLKPIEKDNDFKASFAYLSPSASGSIYQLYGGNEFAKGLSDAFEITDYEAGGESGLSLVIPYPHDSLQRDGIIAAAIEHFAPAIISRSLVLHVDAQIIDHSSIDAQALRVAQHFPAGALREDPVRMLELIRHSSSLPVRTLTVLDFPVKLTELFTDDEREKLKDLFQKSDKLAIAVDVPVVRNGRTTTSRLCAAVAHTPVGRKSLDLFFREGMCLPEVVSRSPAGVDLVIQSSEGELVTYLNFCEGKAHLGLIENKEVAAKLRENGFSQSYQVRRFVRYLADELRALVLPDLTKPDPTTFSNFFSISKPDDTSKRKGAGGGKGQNPPPPPPPPAPPSQPRIFLVDELPDGFRIRSNPGYGKWPLNLRAEVAYADGSRRPAWSRHDFDLSKLQIQQGGGSSALIKKNVIICRDCDASFSLEVRGFDARRELVTNVRGFTNA